LGLLLVRHVFQHALAWLQGANALQILAALQEWKRDVARDFFSQQCVRKLIDMNQAPPFRRPHAHFAVVVVQVFDVVVHVHSLAHQAQVERAKEADIPKQHPW